MTGYSPGPIRPAAPWAWRRFHSPRVPFFRFRPTFSKSRSRWRSHGGVSGTPGWAFGIGLWQLLGPWFFQYVPGFSREKFEFVGSLFLGNAFLAIFAAAFTPIPYKVFTIAAGVCGVPLGTLVAASALGRGLRFFLVAAVTYFLGDTAKRFLDRYLELVTVFLAVAVVAGFFAIRLVMPGR